MSRDHTGACVALPALDGRFALGYLAALGTIELLTNAGRPARLSWSEEDASARLYCDGIENVDDLVLAIKQTIDAMSDDQLVPSGLTGFPAASPHSAALVKVDPDQYRSLAEQASTSPDPDIAEAWVSSLATDVVLDDAGCTMSTRYGSFSGRQTQRSMLQKPLQLVRDRPDYLREAFLGWRRVDGVSGEYLDHRVLFDAADSPTGESSERGVPGATWLAIMAYAMIRTTSGDARRVISTGWFVDGRRLRLRWGLWRPPLDRAAIKALWENPLLTRAARTPVPPKQTDTEDQQHRGRGNNRSIDDTTRKLNAMGVFMICRAERRKIPGRTFPGVLAPVEGTT